MPDSKPENHQPSRQSPAPASTPTSSTSPEPTQRARRFLNRVTDPSLVHPALIPGIGVEATGRKFATNWFVFAAAAACVIVVLGFGISAPWAFSEVATRMLSWITRNFGWLFSLLTIVVFAFMMWVGFSRYGRIRLGQDDERREYSLFSWIAMLFSAGMGIGLLFFGPYEPLTYFLDVPPGAEAAAGSREAMHTAMAQVIFHWGPMAWAYYALVGGAIAYSAYRRGRSPLISAVFEPIFGQKTRGPLGHIIDVFAILVTLFGTAVSLGIGVLQISQGIQIVGGLGELGNGVIIALMALLTSAFVISAMSGIKRGIRALSNINLVLASILGLSVLIAGPTLFLLNFIPSSAFAFVNELGTMLMRSSTDGPEAAAFMESWTTYYWAWWVSWTPFVGVFIAKISRGRTLREFVTVVIAVPSLVCLIWFGIFGGTAMLLESTGTAMNESGNAQDVLFSLLANLPFGAVTSVLAMVSIIIFFITSADSASIVMGSISQQGQPEPARWISATWGLALGALAGVLLLIGGAGTLSALQSLVTVSALPFAFVLILMMFSWARDLRTDPLTLRDGYARAAIAEGVRRGIEEHGDDFVFSAGAVEPGQGAGSWLDSKDPALTEWYEDAATGAIPLVNTADTGNSTAAGTAEEAAPEEAEQQKKFGAKPDAP
ncbi:BCCT family transporter [Acaricomes phytoseiuli]|uniref:BCCT family transporter n=1 Tax=Acaricomes phytoseiuli TaxID=291968 RepID=UPI00037C3E8A|nr:BCCT family transporter [Acaricomes phytoseiuli]